MTEIVLSVFRAFDSQLGAFCEKLDAPFIQLGDAIGFPDDQIKLMFCYFAAILLGFFMKSFVRGRTPRILFGMIFAIALGVLQFGTGMYSFFVSMIVVYVMILVLPKRNCAMPIFVFAMGFMSYIHIWRVLYQYKSWRMDASLIQMYATCKYIALAWNIQDGSLKKEEQDVLSDYHKTHMVKEKPSLFEFLGYMLFAPCFICGPIYEFAAWKNYVEEKDVFTKIPSTVLPALKMVGQALFWLVAFVLISSYFQVDFLYTDEYGQMNIFAKLAYMNFAMDGNKARYYLAFKFPEAGGVASGLSYEGTKTKGGQIIESFDRLCNLRTRYTEFGLNPKDMTDNWNISTAKWLRYYVYTRIIPESQRNASPSKTTFAMYATMLVSAFWHGFYLSYYLFFFQVAIFCNLGKMFYTTDWPRYVPSVHILKWPVILWMWLVLNYFGLCFALTDSGELFTFIKHTYGIPSLSLFAAFAFFTVTGIHKKKRVPRQPQGKIETETKKETKTD